ncbi:MAG: prephenate dehydratase [Muribaculaceae bacterium]|nr:prephenate dehydratase [Muribaculaceae bacterium]
MRKIGIQGIPGCFHDIAAHEWFSEEEIETIGFASFDDLFSALDADTEMMAAVAIENTIAGALLQNFEYIRKSGRKVIGECKIRVSHSLCALPGTKISEIKEVRSHYMALLQCRQYLSHHPHIKKVEDFDTAGCAKKVAEERMTATAAIAPAYAGRLYGLDILAEGIEDDNRNFTRFLIIGQLDSPTPPDADKISLAFTVPHEKGALSKVLTILTFYDINLTMLQSMPVVGHEWEYRFYADLTFDDCERCEQALAAVKPLTSDFRILGIYRSAKDKLLKIKD